MKRSVGTVAFVLLVPHVLALGAAQDTRTAESAVKPGVDAPSVDAKGRPSGHERMLALLRRVAAETAVDNDYIGTAKLTELRSTFARMTDDWPLVRRLRVYKNLAIEELRLGSTERAIELLTTAYGKIDELPISQRREAAVVLAYNAGVAYLRLGENQNCVARHTPESCLLPIRGGGVHVKPFGSKSAIRYFEDVLSLEQNQPAYRLGARWLLNIAHMTLGEYPKGVPPAQLIPPKTFASDVEFPRFTNVASNLGLDTFDWCGGAIADDFDGDGFLDIITSTWATSGQMRYFRNNGDGTFSERTAEAGLVGLFGGLNINHADYDNDGDLDVLVLRGAWFIGPGGQHPNSLLRNDGRAKFTDVTFDAGLGDVHYPTQTAGWQDYDQDGDLDLYIGNEATDKYRFPCQLFMNNGDGTFTDVAKEAGVENFGYTKGVAWGDYDGDGLADLYVSNLRQPNRFYRNQGDGTFRDVARKLGVTRPLDSFPTWFWDVDNDGALDLYVASYYQAYVPDRLAATVASYLKLPNAAERSRLYRGDGKGGFVEVGDTMNVGLVTQPMGANFGDLNNDGYLDFYLGTGYPYYDGLVPNVMYLNLSGRRFADVTTAGGFGHLQKGHGVAFADLDNDGDQDVFEQMGGFYPGDAFGNVLFENPGFGHHWIKVRLVGTSSNRCAIGARLHVDIVENGRPRSIHRTIKSGGSFGCNPLMQHIGLGKADRVERLRVDWPATGERQTFQRIAADQRIEITEGADAYRVVPERTFRFAGSSRRG